MRYNPTPCTNEQLIPTRWICRREPSRSELAEHLQNLRRKFGSETARECLRRMYWIGIVPINRERFAIKYGLKLEDD